MRSRRKLGTCLPAGRGLESLEGRGFKGFRGHKSHKGYGNFFIKKNTWLYCHIAILLGIKHVTILLK